MNVSYSERFFKDLDDIKDKKLKIKVSEIIYECKKANSLNEVKNLKKLEGYKGYFRIRTGDYRIGISIVGAEIMFMRIANRKDIYKIFP